MALSCEVAKNDPFLRRSTDLAVKYLLLVNGTLIMEQYNFTNNGKGEWRLLIVL